MRLRQSSLVGAVGFVSMEDGCVGGFVQRGIAGASGQEAILEMGGGEAASSESRVSEANLSLCNRAAMRALNHSRNVKKAVRCDKYSDTFGNDVRICAQMAGRYARSCFQSIPEAVGLECSFP
jgi:hypothetical protein